MLAIVCECDGRVLYHLRFKSHPSAAEDGLSRPEDSLGRRQLVGTPRSTSANNPGLYSENAFSGVGGVGLFMFEFRQLRQLRFVSCPSANFRRVGRLA